ncbi:phosphopantetheine-binding protein [Streptomyces sp. TG1A-8]|uniref:phosphopantetheine-binding protein n=1 Tax=Streptomyces sp. TG1A-8 TaxID=3051385 RepID=UPI00265BABC6|nr:phosphopantetheine-binding protein [Streptomyces sp. TG1A-8]MDO0926704.1 phosphopantetheine-binding protein [Streptomyces sp. TG1A-8]
MTVPWDEPFEKILREALPLLPADSALRAGTRLSDHGLDSMATIDTLLRLEQQYEVSFPDEYLTSETFGTPGSLWAVLSGLRAA